MALEHNRQKRLRRKRNRQLAANPEHSLASTLNSPLPDPTPSPSRPSTNDQRSSPLFSKLPPELRNKIFYLALLEHDDVTKPLPANTYAYRPSHHFVKVISGMSLLLTCKLIYLEAYLLPVMAATHLDFQCWESHAPPLRASSSRTAFEKMNVEQRAAVHTIHIIAQQWYLEKPDWARHSLPAVKATGEVRPKKVVITVRYHDWWNWENDERLGMGEAYGDEWRREFRQFGVALEEVVMELETTEERKAELENVMKDVIKWKIELDEGKVLVADKNEVKREVWEGTRIFGDTTTTNAEIDTAPDTEIPKQKYHVLSLRWTCASEA